MRPVSAEKRKNKGFTLIEILTVMGLMTLISSFAVISLLKPQTTATIDTAVNELASDLRGQQIKAMVGYSTGSSVSQPHGIYFEADKYILFAGLSYKPLEPTNAEILLDSPLSLSTTFSSSQLVFSKRSGETAGFVDGQNTVTLTHTETGEQKTITVNRYGVISIN